MIFSVTYFCKFSFISLKHPSLKINVSNWPHAQIYGATNIRSTWLITKPKKKLKTYHSKEQFMYKHTDKISQTHKSPNTHKRTFGKSNSARLRTRRCVDRHWLTRTETKGGSIFQRNRNKRRGSCAPSTLYI